MPRIKIFLMVDILQIKLRSLGLERVINKLTHIQNIDNTIHIQIIYGIYGSVSNTDD